MCYFDSKSAGFYAALQHEMHLFQHYFLLKTRPVCLNKHTCRICFLITIENELI